MELDREPARYVLDVLTSPGVHVGRPASSNTITEVFPPNSPVESLAQKLQEMVALRRGVSAVGVASRKFLRVNPPRAEQRVLAPYLAPQCCPSAPLQAPVSLLQAHCYRSWAWSCSEAVRCARSGVKVKVLEEASTAWATIDSGGSMNFPGASEICSRCNPHGDFARVLDPRHDSLLHFDFNAYALVAVVAVQGIVPEFCEPRRVVA